MSKPQDISSILIIGSGPIIIGQGCEFDYSGTQACKALKEKGYRIILVNSNPATVQTDPNTADATYIEPITVDALTRVIEREKPDAMLPTMGGQTALNCALDLNRLGILKKHNITMLGSDPQAIDRAEDRQQFQALMKTIGLKTPKAKLVRNMDEAMATIEMIGYPAIVRPCFTLGGKGSGIAYNREEFIQCCQNGLLRSPTSEILIDESIIGYKEFEMEAVYDSVGNIQIVCTIENVDPCGIHTGDSITVAPAITLTDKEYQRMRNDTINIIRAVGIQAGAANVQFALDPKTGESYVIEMNPRVSRSSALASKATGFPIAKIAALLAVGYTLPELRNDITGDAIPAFFEPSLDYVVVKIPRFDFQKFQAPESTLNTAMKSVGETMGVGHSFQEALQKAINSLEMGHHGLTPLLDLTEDNVRENLAHILMQGRWDRLWALGDAFRLGLNVEEVYDLCKIDRWFLWQIKELIDLETKIASSDWQAITAEDLLFLKQKGFGDARLAALWQIQTDDLFAYRKKHNLYPAYRRIDSCAAECPTDTAYFYSSYHGKTEVISSKKPPIIIIGGGPNRIGQGIEFDYCCVHAVQALKAMGEETILINCNPETVSTDYDTADQLFFEPLTLESMLAVVHATQPRGVIIHYGGQTPLNLAKALADHGVPILGTTPDAIDRAEDRERFSKLVSDLGLKQPEHIIVKDPSQAADHAKQLGYPIIIRPSYVLGGRAMEILHHEAELHQYLRENLPTQPPYPILLMDRFLQDAVEIDVDAVSDGEAVWIAGIMQHIELAGVHSGDSASCLPPHQISPEMIKTISEQTRAMAEALGVVGSMNIQFALQDGVLYLLEVNPRASRTIPFVAKATGQPIAQIAARCKLGETLKAQGIKVSTHYKHNQPYFCVKQVVFPFHHFEGADPILGPEMRSTGEVMGVGKSFQEAYAKGLEATGQVLPTSGAILVSVRDQDKPKLLPIAKHFVAEGFQLIATEGTAAALREANIPVQAVYKMHQGRPNVVDAIKNGDIHFIVNTAEGKRASKDSFMIRRTALQHHVPYTTTLAGAEAICGILGNTEGKAIYRLQDIEA